MACYMMRSRVEELGIADEFEIESAATSTEEIGNPVYPPAARMLASRGIRCAGHHARQITTRDYDRFDLIIAMDDWNLRNLRRILGGDPEGKVHLMMEYTDRPGEVADPWYTGDFEATWRDLDEGIDGLLGSLGRVDAKTPWTYGKKRRNNKKR